jgi:hypothetical protein
MRRFLVLFLLSIAALVGVEYIGPRVLGTKPVVVTRRHDTRNLWIDLGDRHAPRFDSQGIAPMAEIPPDNRRDGFYIPSCDSVADLIMNRVWPGSWAPELGTSIEDRGGHVVVTQTPYVHLLVAAHLARMRKEQDRRVETCVHFVRLPFAGAPSAPVGGGPPSGAKLLAANSIQCLRGRRGFMIDGWAERIAPNGSLPERGRLRGTVVEVRPTVAKDGQTVEVELRLARYADEAPIEWRAEASIRCKEDETATVTGVAGCDRAIVAYVSVSIVRPFEAD